MGLGFQEQNSERIFEFSSIDNAIFEVHLISRPVRSRCEHDGRKQLTIRAFDQSVLQHF